jgi:hypothetical protein
MKQVRLALVASLFAGQIASAEPAKAPRLFDSLEPLTIDLEADWSVVQRDRAPIPTPRPAKLTYTGPSGPVSLDIQVETRGRSRLRRSVCDFPPILLDIPKETRQGTLFRGIGELKLVTHCERNVKYEQNVLLEYVLYRAYGLLTEHAYRVRLLHVRYHDPGAVKPKIERYGFVIEDAADLAKRLDLSRIAESTIDPALTDTAGASRVEMFLYMIAMTDFSMIAKPEGSCCHNVRMFRRADGVLIPVPYDFDQTGVVDPIYALPDPRLKIKKVTQRRFRGMCRAPGLHAAAIAQLRSKRAEIEALFKQQEGLAPSRATKAVKFLGEFYDWAADPAQVTTTLNEECRQVAR